MPGTGELIVTTDGNLLYARVLALGLMLWPMSSDGSPFMEFDSMPKSQIQQAAVLMDDFAVRSGLDGDRPGRRYLWTDAFAVCNFLGLAKDTGERRYRDLALRLAGQVHHTLGRHRQDDRRHGWISGLAEGEGEAHPTQGGVRIGKALPERDPGAPFDERMEWDRDGQYFHYLTKWMLALDQLSRATGESRYNLWARELAVTAHDAFTVPPTGGRPARMYWKMSIDLSRPLVTSMGQHDPLDGYVTALQLQTTAAASAAPTSGPDLTEIIRSYQVMANQTQWATPDTLGIGGLLVDAYRAAQLQRSGTSIDRHLVEKLLDAALIGLRYYMASGESKAPAEYRLAFRELGLAIGLQAAERLSRLPRQAGVRTEEGVNSAFEALHRYLPLSQQLRDFWLDPGHRSVHSWEEHRDINEVMLATALLPDGFLELATVE